MAFISHHFIDEHIRSFAILSFGSRSTDPVDTIDVRNVHLFGARPPLGPRDSHSHRIPFLCTFIILNRASEMWVLYQTSDGVIFYLTCEQHSATRSYVVLLSDHKVDKILQICRAPPVLPIFGTLHLFFKFEKPIGHPSNTDTLETNFTIDRNERIHRTTF